MLDAESKLSQALDDATKEELEFPIVLIATEEILPEALEWEKQFVVADNSKLQIEVDIQEANASKTDETVNFQKRILNYANYVRRGIQKIFTEQFMAERIRGLLEQGLV